MRVSARNEALGLIAQPVTLDQPEFEGVSVKCHVPPSVLKKKEEVEYEQWIRETMNEPKGS